MTSLLDVNVLLPLAWSNHPHHVAAVRWFQQRGNDLWATCLFTQSAFFRLSMNPVVVNATNSIEMVGRSLAELTSQPGHEFLDAAPPLAEGAFGEMSSRLTGYRQVTDATLLHIAAHHGAKLATFDRAIERLSPAHGSVELLLA